MNIINFPNFTAWLELAAPFRNLGSAPELCEVDGGDLFEADNAKLSTARLQMRQIPPCFSQTSNVEKTVIFLPYCVHAKGEKASPYPK